MISPGPTWLRSFRASQWAHCACGPWRTNWTLNSLQDFLSCVWVDLACSKFLNPWKNDLPISSNSEDSFFQTFIRWSKTVPSILRGTSMSHQWERKVIFPSTFGWDVLLPGSRVHLMLSTLQLGGGFIHVFYFHQKIPGENYPLWFDKYFSDGWQKNTNPIGSMYGYIYLHLPFFTIKNNQL